MSDYSEDGITGVSADAWAKPIDQLTVHEARAVLADMRSRVDAMQAGAADRRRASDALYARVAALTAEVSEARGQLAHTQGEVNRLMHQLREQDELARQHGLPVYPPP